MRPFAISFVDTRRFGLTCNLPRPIFPNSKCRRRRLSAALSSLKQACPGLHPVEQLPSTPFFCALQLLLKQRPEALSLTHIATPCLANSPSTLTSLSPSLSYVLPCLPFRSLTFCFIEGRRARSSGRTSSSASSRWRVRLRGACSRREAWPNHGPRALSVLHRCERHPRRS